MKTAIEDTTASELIKACHVTKPLTDPEAIQGTEEYQNWEKLKAEIRAREKAFYDARRVPKELLGKIKVFLENFWENLWEEESLTEQEEQILKEIEHQLMEEWKNKPENKERHEKMLQELKERQLRLRAERQSSKLSEKMP